LKFHYYDANCLVKLVIKESGSSELQQSVEDLESVAITTSFCFYEALGVLKTKWSRQNRTDAISQKDYLTASAELCALIEGGNIQLEEFSFYDYESFRQSRKITEQHGIDLSDSFQLITLKKGMMAGLKTSIIPQLITEDKGIKLAAEELGLSVLRIDELNV
jgi:predicted nucleic acid-binding protein